MSISRMRIILKMRTTHLIKNFSSNEKIDSQNSFIVTLKLLQSLFLSQINIMISLLKNKDKSKEHQNNSPHQIPHIDIDINL